MENVLRVKDATQRLAEARNECVDQIRRRFSKTDLQACPKRFSKHLPALRSAKLEATGVEDGLAWVSLENGWIFYSPLSHPALRREYRYISDKLPKCVTEDTYLAAIDVVHRYLTDFAWPPEGLVPQGNANIVELGAYLGHKTIRFADKLAGARGRVLAVEMMPENCEILRRTISVNGFDNLVDVRAVGVWQESGTVDVYSKGRQRNSILPIAKLESGERMTAEVLTLDEILDEWGVNPVNLVFVTVNGAEIEALQGFHPEGREVGAFFIAAPYRRGGTANADVCRELLSNFGYQILNVGNFRLVVARKN